MGRGTLWVDGSKTNYDRRPANADGAAFTRAIGDIHVNAHSNRHTHTNTDADSVFNGHPNGDSYTDIDPNPGNARSGDQCRDARSLCRPHRYSFSIRDDPAARAATAL